MKIKANSISLRTILMSIGVGVWAIVLQNAGVIPRLIGVKNGVQTVYVKGGYIDADVSGTVDVDDVHGTVNVSGDIDVNIARINGHRNVFYQDRDGAYMVLPVTVR